MQKKLFSLLIVLAMVVSLLSPLGQSVKGVVAVSVGSIPSYIPIDCSDTGTPGNGTPIAVFVRATGGAANTTYQIKSRVGPTTSALTYAIWWANVGTSPSWGFDGTAWATTWPITTDGSGNWSGWLVTKVNTSITSNSSFNWSQNIFYVARFREGSSNRDSGSVSITPLNMASSGSGTLGGWIEGTAYLADGTTRASNCPVVVKNSGGTIVGIYMTEDNSVNEGYPTTSGYYKVAASAGTGYSVEVWDSTNTKIGKATSNVYVKPGQTTSNVGINGGSVVVPPTVFSVSPSNNATGVPVNTTITTTFDRDMDSTTINTTTFTVKDASNNPVSGTVTYSNKVATFTPSSNLANSTTYTVTISGSVKDTNGNAIGSDYSWSFTTQAPGPSVVSVSPSNNATGVPVNTTITATFDRDMDPTTITASTFAVKDASNNPVSGTVTYSNKVATFTPSSNLVNSTKYTATISGNVKDTNGLLMGTDYSWSFTTVEAPITIAAARALSVGSTIYIRGNVTVVPGTFNRGFAIQDSTGGIYIYPSTQPTGISLGDVVEVRGTTTNYNGLLEVNCTSDQITKISSGTCPAPVTKAISEIGESTEGLLVKVSGTVSSVSGTGNKTIVITDGDKSLQVYVYSTTGINTSSILVRDSITVTGFSGQYSSNYQVQPRYQSDIVNNKPQVLSTTPSNGATSVPTNTTISVTFDRALDPSTVSTSTVTVKDSDNNPVSGTVSYDDAAYKITFTPSSLLSYDVFTVMISKDIKDTNGNKMSADYTFEFSTIIFELPSPTATFTQSADTSLKVFAVMYDSLEQSINQKGESICIMNTGSTSLDISNYAITDFEGAVKFPQSTSIAPNSRIWVTREAVEFEKEFNKKPDYEYGADTDPTVPNLPQVDILGITQVSGSYPVLDDSADEVAVFDPSNNIVDVVAWGISDYANTGWSGAKITPYIFASYISPNGDIAYRKLNETTGMPVPDTNTLNDWSWDPTDPIDGCKIMYPGWDTWDSYLFFPVKHTATVTTTFFASPDNSYTAVANLIDSATSSIKIELYEITEIEIMNKVLAKMDSGVQVTVLMDGNLLESNGKLYSQVSWFAQQVYNKGGQVYFLRNTSPNYPHDRYNNVHIKTIIVDDSKVLITSDNITRSSMPCDDFSNGTLGQRGTGIITNDPVIVNGVLAIFNHDFQIGYYDVSPYDPVNDAPPAGYTPPAMTDQTGYMPVLSQPLTVTESEDLELIDSPDTSMRNVDSIIGLINKAGAGDLIIDETQYEYLYWGPSGSQYINPRLQAMIAAANRGANVYLLLDSYNSSSTNTPTKTYLDNLGISTLHCLLGHPTGLGIHNKLFLARIGGVGYVNVASINGSENASRANRELGITIKSNAGFVYYYTMFAYDWQASGGTPLPSNPEALCYIFATTNEGGTISPSGAVTVEYGKDKSFTITPETGYRLLDVKVDGVSVGAVTTYTFTNVTSNHTISVTFAINTYTVTASADFGGTISPSGAIPVTYGLSKSFTIKANPGYFIYRILVDGSPISFNNSFEYTYTFKNVASNHTIEAQFMKQPDLTPPTLALPTINGVDLNTPNALIKVNTPTLTFTVQATDESGIGRLVVKVNGVTQIDKNNLDPTITLQEGMNTVEVTVYDTYGNFVTKSFKVLKDTEGPTIILPSDLPQTVSSNTFTLKGTVIDNASGISTLTINGKPVIPTLNGNFELQLTLTQGTNTITIEAVDKLNNKTTKTLTLSYTTPQSKSYIITLKVGDPHITINGIEKNIDSQGSKPIIQNDRTLLPIRVLIESLGGTIEWDNTQRKVTITLGYNTIELFIGKPIAKVNGVNTPIDSTNPKVVPQIINGRTYLPLRFISENLGASVDWDSTTQTITIYYFR